MNRGNIKLAIDRCIAHDVPDAADMIESLRQQLSAALAACKLKDAAIKDLLEFATYSTCGKAHAVEAAKEALAIQPDDSALKAWIGEPVAWMITYDGKCMGFVPTEEANTVAAYSPKGLK